MGNSNSNEESKKTFDWLDREDRDGVLSLNQILHAEKLIGVDNWEDTHSPLLLFRFDESQEGSINYQEFNKLLKHLKEANKKREARMKELEKRKKKEEKLTSPAKTHKVWTAVDQNSAHELDLSRDSTTPAITGKPPREGIPLSSSTENLREEELEELIKEEARHFFGKLIQKSSGRKQFLTWLFHLADTDKSGNISMEELQVILRALAHDGIMPENLTFESEDAKAQVEKIMAEYNTGKSGVLSKEEFMVLADLILKNYECITDKEDKTVGKYTLKRKLGDGSTGSVWVAVDKTSKQKRAIKIIKKGDVSDLSRIDVEIKAMLMLKHPNIVGLDEVLETEDSVFLVEELCGGGSLHEHVAEKPFKEPKARYYFKQVVDGVAYCHSVGVCHRDLKLENLLLDNNGNLKITDFGHAGIFSKGWDIFSSGLVGSLYHVSPEQISGKSYSGEKIDIWAIGILLYRLLVGKPLFFSPNPHEFVENIMNTRFTFPSHLSKEVVDLISKILKIDPEERLSLEDIVKHPWCQGPTKQLDLNRDKLRLPTGTELQAVWGPLKQVLDSFAIHCHEPTLRENASIKCIYKCIYPRKDLKFSVVFRDSPHNDKIVLEFILKNGESFVFKKTIDKIKARLKAYINHSISDEDLTKFSLKKSKEEEL